MERDTRKGDVDAQQQLTWKNGSALLKTRATRSDRQCGFITNDLVVVIHFLDPGSEATWQLDGKIAHPSGSPAVVSHGLLIIPPGCEFRANHRTSGQGLLLHLDPRLVANNNRVRSFFSKATVNYSWINDKLAWIIASEIRREFRNDFPRGAMFIESAASTFVARLPYILDGAAPRRQKLRALSGSKLSDIIEYIDNNIHRNITLSDLSSLVQLTPGYFCRAFKQAMGQPPHQYLIEQRVERARILLQDPNQSLADVALDVGFNSQSHMHGHFRRIIGITPSRYRIEVQRSRASSSDPDNC